LILGARAVETVRLQDHQVIVSLRFQE
jgi:hypothetical protein